MLKQPVRTSLSDFIKTSMGSQFVIPVYQRNYTWNPEKETTRFMADIENLLNQKSTNHFLGIIIYMESEVSTMFRQLQIVDGQQRLTTSFIFLLALKNEALAKKNKMVAEMIDDYYLYNRHTKEEAKLRLKPTISDDDVYSKIIYGNGENCTRKEKESIVYRNYDFILHRIRELERNHSLLEILDTLAKVDILEFPLSETDNAQQIFESINSTGAPLTSADLIRNYILMNHTNEVQERWYKVYWKPLEAYYPESRKLEDFFRCYLAVKTYSLLSRRDVYDGFKDYWSAIKQDTEEGLKDIGRYCRYMYEIYNGPIQGKLAEAALEDFRKNESRLPAPFLMEMAHLYDTKKISEREFAALVQTIDSYMTRRALCGKDTGALSRYFPTLLRSVMMGFQKKQQDIITLTKVNLINYNRGKALAMPTDDQLRTQLREINAYSLMCIRPVLDRIEHFGAHAKVDLEDLNIEHIMPQTPNNWWKKNAGVEDDDDYTAVCNLIGNLTLCAEMDNSKIGNKNFAYKKKVLEKTNHIRMNTKILKLKHWTKQDVLNRCDELANIIIKIYPYSMGREETTTKNTNMLILSTPSVEARAMIRKNNVQILTGSTMKAYGDKEMKANRNQFIRLYDRGIIKETQDGKMEFIQNYSFHDLNEAASFLMHRGGENSNAWKYEDGRGLNEPLKQEKSSAVSKPKKNEENHPSHKPSHVSRSRKQVGLNSQPTRKSNRKHETKTQNKRYSRQNRPHSNIHPQSEKSKATKKIQTGGRVLFAGERER